MKSGDGLYEPAAVSFPQSLFACLSASLSNDFFAYLYSIRISG